MTKSELVSAIAEKTGVTKKVATEQFNVVFSTISEALAKGEKVQVKDFGTFETRSRAARKGLNPQTKQPIEIPATVVPAFKASSVLKRAVKH